MRMSSIGYDNFSFTKEQLAMLEERDQTIGDLQFSLDERTMQLEEVWPDNMTSSAVCSEAVISIVVKKKMMLVKFCWMLASIF